MLPVSYFNSNFCLFYSVLNTHHLQHGIVLSLFIHSKLKYLLLTISPSVRQYTTVAAIYGSLSNIPLFLSHSPYSHIQHIRHIPWIYHHISYCQSYCPFIFYPCPKRCIISSCYWSVCFNRQRDVFFLLSLLILSITYLKT